MPNGEHPRVFTAHDKTHRTPLQTLVILGKSFREPRFRFLIGATTTLVIAAALVMRVLDHKEYHSIGRALWWSVQTVGQRRPARVRRPPAPGERADRT